MKGALYRKLKAKQENMNKRKDSENFPSLEVDVNKPGIIDPLESIDMTTMSKKINSKVSKKEKEDEKNSDTLEKMLKDTNNKDIGQIVEEPDKNLKLKLKKKRVISKRQDIVTQFEKMFEKIQINENLQNFKDLVVIDFENKPSLEEIEPTKPKELRYKTRKSKQTNFKKNSNEVMLLTKGKMNK